MRKIIIENMRTKMTQDPIYNNLKLSNLENNNAICNTGQRTKICFVWFVFYPWKLVLQDYKSRYEQRMRRFSIYWDCLLPSWLPAPICFPLHSTTTFLLAPICHHKYIDIPHLCFVVWKADVSKKNYEKNHISYEALKHFT